MSTYLATEEQLIFLDELRESGETNMWGSPAYVQSEFGVGKKQAGDIVQNWMETFESRHKCS